MIATFFETVTALVEHHYESIYNLHPQDGEGLWVWADGLLPTLKVELQPTLGQLEWIITSETDSRLLIEPRFPPRVTWTETCYHVSDKCNRAAIHAEGLQPKTGGNTTMCRFYTPRIFLAKDFLAALEFIEFQCRKATPDVNRQGAATGKKKNRDELDLWRVTLPTANVLYRDVLFPKVAAWTESSIAPDCLELVESWSELEIVWRKLRAGVLE